MVSSNGLKGFEGNPTVQLVPRPGAQADGRIEDEVKGGPILGPESMNSVSKVMRIVTTSMNSFPRKTSPASVPGRGLAGGGGGPRGGGRGGGSRGPTSCRR
ncbi:MAG: hypothetical protein F4Y74_12600 [Gemmatimonadales bacterium]|nr:hypothetical protein [Gemmatimonadales bacterium]MYG19745.1 hypothetical protein [Gemmatimonadales bacterium]